MSWYALHTRSNHERQVEDALRFFGVTGFCPRYKVPTRRQDRKAASLPPVEKVLFPGYVFADFDIEDLDRRHRIIAIPGVLRIVGYGEEPLEISAADVEAVRMMALSPLPIEPAPVTPGEVVIVKSGPLAGVEGVVVHIKGSMRIVVSIGLLNRGVSAEVDASCLEVVKQAA